ncbi:MAG: 30S ribosomal protein S12 methylthiotransferase RimO [Candidatus Aminicenantes bacterium]|nr:30S ribosomal protein S12 methylthiotransferase RimO [Candidatus Aminicenantes bacterium]
MKTVSLITFGCAKNLVDSEVMAGCLREAGYALASDLSKSDIVILNTCGFIGPAKDEAVAAIENALALKRKKPSTRVVIAGCFTERYEPELRKTYPRVDAWVGVKDYDQIVSIVEGKDFRASDRTFLLSHRTPRALSTPASWAYLKISEGCSHRCAFCSIPLIKGTYRSRPISSILEEARRLAAAGVKEINLISQDTTYFGRDKNRSGRLAGLLRGLTEIGGLEWIRILYGYPEEITSGLLEAMREPKICPYLDIPFQHAAPALVRKMKRAMDGDRALRLLERIRKNLPGAAIRTSLIVGFPGEGPSEFRALQSFVREAAFDHLGVFTYSREDGTAAYRFGDPIDERLKQERREAILSLQAGISSSKLKEHVGRTLDVLLEGAWKEDAKTLIGRARFQAPEVDGVVFVRRPSRSDLPLGPIQKVEITASDVYDLQGKTAE